MRTTLTSREAKDVVRSHISVLKIYIAYIYALWHFHSFLILLLQNSVMKIYYLLYIHGIYIYKHIYIYIYVWGQEEGSDPNFSAAIKKVYIHHKIFQ